MNARTILNQWIEQVNAGNVDDVVALYADDAALIPTFSARTLRTQAERADYFQNLGSRPNASVALHEPTVHEQRVSDSVSVLSGLYTFRFEVDGQLLTFEARFTFVVDSARPAPILHHHSSQIPRGLS